MRARIQATIALLLFATALFGQRASITGRVTDSAGATAPGARVVITGAATGVASTAVSNSEGYYSVPFLTPGAYSVRVELEGFQTAVLSGITLETEQVARVDVTLRVGAVSERIEVTAAQPVLDSETVGTGTMMDSKTISEMPTPGGGVYALMQLGGEPLTAAVTATMDPTTPRLGAAVAMAGTRANNTEFYLDGMPTMTRTMSAKMVPTEAVREFRVDVATADASLGHSAGGYVNTSLKSGTNRLHGSLWEFNHSRFMRAMDFFAKRWLNNPATGPIDDTKRALAQPANNINRNGVSAGGPVWIPRLYDGRNRTFFMYTFEHIAWRRSSGGSYTVPTAAERRGDFSELLKLGAQYQIYDPASVTPAAGGRYSRLPLANNVVPASRISPIAQKILPYWPDANASGTADGTNNYFSPMPFHTFSSSHVIRIDHAFDERNKLSFSGSAFDQPVSVTVTLPNVANERPTDDRVRYFVAEYVRILSPSFVLSVRAGTTYWKRVIAPVSTGMDLTALGFSRSLADLLGPDGRYFPTVNPTGYTALGAAGRTSYFDNTPVLAVNVTKSLGRHSLRFGADLRLLRESASDLGFASPQFLFNTDWTRGPLDNSAASPLGQGLASFLLGLPTGGQVNRNPSYAEQNRYQAYYLQDDFKLTPRLTLNLGLRYEYEGATTERYNRSLREFDGSATNPVEARARANYARTPIPEVPAADFRTPGGVTFAGVNGRPRGLWTPDGNNFAPRIGLAWAFTPRTVLRAGYSILYDTLGINHQHVIQTGFEQPTNLIPTLDNGQHFVADLANPFPNGIQEAPGAARGLATYVGRAVSFYDPNPRSPYMQRWTLDLQRELQRGVRFYAAYLGNRGTKLQVSRQLDPVPAQYLSTLPVRDNAVNGMLTANVANPFQNIAEFAGSNMTGATVARSQLLKPMPQFTGVTASFPAGSSWYHSLRTRLESRFAAGYLFQFSYTFSKFMEAVSYLNETDSVPARVISPQDRPHRVVASGIWELPVGRGKKLLPGIPGWLNHVLGGWQINAAVQFQSGAPLEFGNVLFSGNIKDIVLASDQRGVDRWFNTEAGFDKVAGRQLVNNVRTFPNRFGGIRAPASSAWNASLAKTLRVSERVRLQLRAEGYNVFNQTDLGAPIMVPTNQAFGQITGVLGDSNSRWATAVVKAIF
jgi:outer membrane receptor protein involved in Fe transport